MEHKRDRISHLVRVARIRIETTVIEIDGDDIDDEDAERQAIENAELLPDDVWSLQPFNENRKQLVYPWLIYWLPGSNFTDCQAAARTQQPDLLLGAEP